MIMVRVRLYQRVRDERGELEPAELSLLRAAGVGMEEAMAVVVVGGGEEEEKVKAAVAARAAHRLTTTQWLEDRPGRSNVLPSPSLRASLCLIGTPIEHRFVLWQRTLGVYGMPSLSSQAAQVRQMLATELSGQKALEADCEAAILSAWARASGFPAAAIDMLSQELSFLLLLLLKRCRLPYTPDLGITHPPLLLLAAAFSASMSLADPTEGLDNHDGLIGKSDLATVRSDTYVYYPHAWPNSALQALRASMGSERRQRLTVTAAKPALIIFLWLLLQWRAPRYPAIYNAATSRLSMQSHYIILPLDPPPAYLRLVELTCGTRCRRSQSAIPHCSYSPGL